MDFFNQDVIRKLDMSTIRKIYQMIIVGMEKQEPTHGMVDVLTLLQALAYNRYKSEHKEEIADFVLDQLFELILSGDIF